MEPSTVDVVIRNTPAAVAGASFYDWFVALPITPIVQLITGVWIAIQAGFYVYDRFKGKK